MPSAARIFGKKIPIPIPKEFDNCTNLLHFLELTPSELKKIWWYHDRMYKSFSIRKNGKKNRTIAAPDNRLKFFQRRIASRLDQLYRLRNPVHGFVATRSVKTNAEAHGARRFLVNLDLSDFFPTITERRVLGLLTSLGVDESVSGIIARLCCYKGQLPQGAPTSPVLSNMICYRLDTELLRIAKDARAIYTRYADDITFSSHQPPTSLFGGIMPSAGHFSPDQLSQHLITAIESNGFKINSDKSHYADRNSRRVVTGVKINAGLNVDRRYVRQIRALLYSIENIGLPNAQKKYDSLGLNGEISMHLRGKISYIKHLKGATDPVVRSLVKKHNRIFLENPIILTPTNEERRDRSVWVLEHDGNQGQQGTAFFLNGVGLVTAAHCVANSVNLVVYHPTKHSNKYTVTIKKICPHRDLAILEHTIQEDDFFEFSSAINAVAVGDNVTAYGYPGFANGDKLNMRPGTVVSLPVRHAVNYIETTQQLAQGMSGGPILNRLDQVAGVIHKGGPTEGRQLAVNIRHLLDLFAE